MADNAGTTLRILHLEDSPLDAEIIRERLIDAGFSMQIDWTTNEQGFLAFLQKGGYDFILADYHLPCFDGTAALRMAQTLCPEIPFICVSGAIGEENAVELLKHGATDYVLKNRLDKLPLAIQRALDEVGERRARRLAEEEIEKLNRTLEARVIEVVGELRQKDQLLIQQSRLAAMGEMFGNIAHQWRQPLNNVGLIIQNVQLEYDSGTLTREEMDSSIKQAMEAIVQMSRTIDDFRNFFREDKEKDNFLISRTVQRALTLVSATLNNDNIDIEISTSVEAVAVGYQNEYAQVLLNIIANSREAAKERHIPHPRLLIRIDRENDHSVLYIRDNCGGIPEDAMPRIFDPYFTTRGPDRGTGIGLYMSKVIIEKNMGGHLTACNIEDGAEFRIEV